MAKRPKSAITTSTFNGDEIRPKESQGFNEARAAKGLTTVEGTTPAACTPPAAVSPDPCRHEFVSSAGASFPVARLGIDVQQT